MRVCFVHSSNQNVFFTEMLDAFEQAVRSRGIETLRTVDHFPAPQDDLVALFVPHEYHPLVQPDSRPTYRQLRRSVALCTEQPGTHWFEEAAAIARDAGAAVDINELGVEELRRRGVRATLVRLGYVPAWDRWGGDSAAPRPIDVTFMGGHTARRAQMLASCGGLLQRRRASLHVFETFRPHRADDPHFLSGDRKWDVLRQAKAIVNVHRSELGYMEWQRVLGAMANGCVVVTEHSLGYDPLIPGKHFVSAAFADTPSVLAALLDDPEWLASIRTAAYTLLREEMPIETALDALLEALEAVAAVPLPQPDPGEPAPLPRPKAPEMPPPPYAVPRDGDSAILRMAMKQLALETRALRRELHALTTPGEDLARDEYETFGPYADATPDVSVVMTVFNYADYVGEALASVARSDHPSYELVIVDDASRDESVEVVRKTLSGLPWVPARLVRHGVNRGLAPARNRGIEEAHGRYVFMLDADNVVYPHALSRLAGALDDDPGVHFAYGLIETFDEAGPRGLLSFLGWDPERLRYGNFVDAMAMMRRDALLEIGGYSTDPVLYGWEDFALWCAFAQAGRHGVRVPEILSRYRVGRHSMISMTNIDDSSLWAALLRQFPVLREPSGAARISVPAVARSAAMTATT